MKIFNDYSDPKHEASADEGNEEQKEKDPSSSTTQFLLFTIHVYLTTGVVMCQGTSYELWAKKEFHYLKERVERLPSDVESADTHAVITNDLIPNLQEMTDSTLRTKKPSKIACDKVKPLEMTEINGSDTFIHGTPKTSKTIDRKRRNSFDSIRDLSPRNVKSISDLRTTMCSLEAELTEMRMELSVSLQNQDKISLLEDKIVQQENNNKIEIKTLTSRVIDLEVENNQLKEEVAKLKTDMQALKKATKATSKSVLVHQAQQCDEVIVCESKQPESPPSVLDIPVHPNQFAALDASNASPSANNQNKEKIDTRATETQNNKSNKHPPANEDNYDFVFLSDSNAKYIELNKLCRDKEVNHHFTPTIASAIDYVKSSDLGNPSNILIHTGTNDLDRLPLRECISGFEELINLVAQRYPRSRVLLSTLIIRADKFEASRTQINGKLRLLSVPSNVHFIHHENISEDMLYDKKHLRRRFVGNLVRNLKDVIYNRTQNRIVPSRNTRMFADRTVPPRHHLIDYGSPSQRPQQPPLLPSAHFAQGPGDRRVSTYAEIVGKASPLPDKHIEPPALHANTPNPNRGTTYATGGNIDTAVPDPNLLMKLIKLYDMIRQA